MNNKVRYKVYFKEIEHIRMAHWEVSANKIVLIVSINIGMN